MQSKHNRLACSVLPFLAAGTLYGVAATTVLADPLVSVQIVEGGDYFINANGMAEGANAFDSEEGRYANVPSFLLGGDLLVTDADDKDDEDIVLIVTVQAPATVYLLHTDAAGLPAWVSADYDDSGEDLTLQGEDADWTYSIYSREISGSGLVEVTLRNNSTFDLDDDIMYGLVGVAEAASCLPDIDEDGELTLFDFLAFQDLFDAGDSQADFDGDGDLTLFDFLAFQSAFDSGCP